MCVCVCVYVCLYIFEMLKDNSTLLNIYVRKLSLEDHPAFIEEERLAVRLKQLYHQYFILLERGALFYLVSRLKNVIQSLEELINKDIDPSDDSDDVLMLDYLSNDLLESLPAVIELRQDFQSLTANIYSIWSQIKDIRSKNGFTRYIKHN